MKRVMIVDDEEQIRDVLMKILQRHGYQVVVAEHGRQAVSIFESNPVDLIITDITMPQMDGLETIRTILSNNPQVPIIAISGGGHRFPDYFLPMAQQSGAKMVLKKPIRSQELVKAVESLIGGGAIGAGV